MECEVNSEVLLTVMHEEESICPVRNEIILIDVMQVCAEIP